MFVTISEGMACKAGLGTGYKTKSLANSPNKMREARKPKITTNKFAKTSNYTFYMSYPEAS